MRKIFVNTINKFSTCNMRYATKEVNFFANLIQLFTDLMNMKFIKFNKLKKNNTAQNGDYI